MKQWVNWTVDNLFRGCEPKDLVATMTAAKVEASAAQQIVVEAVALKQAQALHKLESVVSILASLQIEQWAAGHTSTMERVSSLSPAKFLAKYYFGSRPVILTKLAQDWPALKLWTPEYFADKFGDAMIEIQSGRDQDPNYEINSPKLKRRVRMRDFVTSVLDGSAGNNQYLTANNHALKQPALAPLLDDIGSLPDFLFDRSRLPNESLLWMGGEGVITPVHHDTMQLMHTQIVGQKRWQLVSPLQTPLMYNHIGVFSKLKFDADDEVLYPLSKQLRIIDVIVKPGETLFVPVGWWHHVETLTPSISLSYTNFAPTGVTSTVPNHFTYRNPHEAD
jgi:ribosomal protein L16 Arg81 hydroxylase